MLFGRKEDDEVLELNHPVGSSEHEFKKKLRWKIMNPPSVAERVTITPAIAASMLEWNDKNRPVKVNLISKYAECMKEGRWHFTGEPIIFSTSRMLDGQHRCLASIEAGRSFDVLVVYGAPDDSFAFIDVGAKRSPGDVFAINGVKNATLMAAAMQWVYTYEAGTINEAGHSKLDHAALYDAYMRHPHLQDSAWVGHLFAQKRIASPATMIAIHYLAARKSRKEADEFFRKVGEGLGFAGKKDPAYRLHKRLTDSAISQEKLGRKQSAALTVKAWNAHRLGRDVGTLKFSADESFPKVI